MKRVLFLSLALLPLAGCTSLHKPCIARDFYETEFRASQALGGDEAAFARLGELRATWRARGEQGIAYRLMPWDRRNRDRAGEIGVLASRVLDAKESIVAQRELQDVMLNAVKDIESELDGIVDLYASGDGAVASLALAADQKYLTRRMGNSLLVMSSADMTGAVEAADTFGRDVSRFQQQLDAAMNGNEDLGVEPPDSPDIEDSLGQVEELFSSYIADSSNDVLEYVVARYDAWQALGELSVFGDGILRPATKAAPAPVADAGAAPPAGGDTAAAVVEDDEEEAADDATGDEGAAGSGAQDGGSANDGMPGTGVDAGTGAGVDDEADDSGDDDAADGEAADDEVIEEAPVAVKPAVKALVKPVARPVAKPAAKTPPKIPVPVKKSATVPAGR